MKNPVIEQLEWLLFAFLSIFILMTIMPKPAIAEDKLGLLGALADLDLSALSTVVHEPMPTRDLDLALSGVGARITGTFAYMRSQPGTRQYERSTRGGQRADSVGQTGSRLDHVRPGISEQADHTSDRSLVTNLQHTLSYALTPAGRCWERLLLSGSDTTGSIILHLTYDAGGSVIGASVQRDSIGRPELTGCVLRHARRAHTAIPLGDRVFVELPLRFHPASQPQSTIPTILAGN